MKLNKYDNNYLTNNMGFSCGKGKTHILVIKILIFLNTGATYFKEV